MVVPEHSCTATQEVGDMQSGPGPPDLALPGYRLGGLCQVLEYLEVRGRSE